MSVFHEVLKQYWGYDQFRSLQEDIITSICEGKDTLGLMPTGGGKSITFQVPALTQEGICIVITPLIALMKDQVDNLRKLGIKAAAVYSGMSRQEIIITLENCIFGDYKFLYISPERLWTELFLSKLQYMKVSFLVVDESHCISQWGYDFRPSYMRIAEIRERISGAPILALTATATPEVINDIQEKLQFRNKNVFRKSFERKNLVYVVRQTEDKLYEIENILNKVAGTAIVYVRSRRLTKEIASELSALGISADFFHAGLNPEIKVQKQNAWKSGACRVIVCTNAFGMGIDKPDVRVVIHYEVPSSIEEYYQEAGRAGRDEQKAYAIALCSTRDKSKLKKRISDEFPDKEMIKNVYEKLAYYFQVAVGSGFQATFEFNLNDFCSTFKYNITQAHSAIKILVLSGYLEYLEEEEHRSRLIFLTKRDDLYKSSFNPQTEELMQIILRSYTGLFSDYVYIDESLLSTRTGMSSHEIYESLKMLSSLRIIHYIPAKKTPFITYTQRREDLKYVQIPPEVYEERKKRLTERINHIIHYSETKNQCRSRILLTYFGEKSARDCGQCDICIAKKKQDSTQIYQEIEALLLKNLEEKDWKINNLVNSLPFPEEQTIEVIRYLSEKGKVCMDKTTIKKNA